MTTFVLVHGGFGSPAELAPARLGVEPIEIASDHAVFALRPHELAPLLVG